MNPQLPQSFNHKTEKLATGRVYHFVDQLPDNYLPRRNTTLLCVHGFPDLWYGWRYQIGPWVRRGYRVVVPDMLGYGGTQKPIEASDYSAKKLCADLAALLDLLEIKSAVIIGHDWGAFIAGRFALWYSNRILALAMLSVAYTPPTRSFISLEEIVKRTPNLGYQLYFASDKSNLEILAHLKKFLSVIYTLKPREITSSGSSEDQLLHGPDSSSLTDQEFNYYYAEFSKGEMVGPLNYYRTTRFRYDEELGLPSADLRPDLPYLFIWGTKDPTAVPSAIAKSRKYIPRYQDIALEGRRHWLMVEAKHEITESIIKWLEGLSFKCLEKL
jgi:soluble epoxide hydrolase/lipid-phosphate phosphatase